MRQCLTDALATRTSRVEAGSCILLACVKTRMPRHMHVANRVLLAWRGQPQEARRRSWRDGLGQAFGPLASMLELSIVNRRRTCPRAWLQHDNPNAKPLRSAKAANVTDSRTIAAKSVGK